MIYGQLGSHSCDLLDCACAVEENLQRCSRLPLCLYTLGVILTLKSFVICITTFIALSLFKKRDNMKCKWCMNTCIKLQHFQTGGFQSLF